MRVIDFKSRLIDLLPIEARQKEKEIVEELLQNVLEDVTRDEGLDESRVCALTREIAAKRVKH